MDTIKNEVTDEIDLLIRKQKKQRTIILVSVFLLIWVLAVIFNFGYTFLPLSENVVGVFAIIANILVAISSTLTIPILLRYAIIRKPLGKGLSISIALVNYILVNIVCLIFNVLGMVVIFQRLIIIFASFFAYKILREE